MIVPQGTVAQYFWEQFVEENNLDASSIEVINSLDAASLLQTNDADAYAINYYQIKYMESLGMGRIIADSFDMKHGTTSYVVEVVTSLLKEDPQVGVAMDKALIRAYREAVSDPQALADASATEDIPGEIMVAEYEFDSSLSYLSPEITDETREYFEYLNTWLAEHSLIQKKQDLSTFVDTSYYETALEELGSE